MSGERKELHVVCGPPACGKLGDGRRLAGELGAAFLDSDTATESVVKAGLAAAGMSVDDRDSPEYKRHFRGVGRRASGAPGVAVIGVVFADGAPLTPAEERPPTPPVFFPPTVRGEALFLAADKGVKHDLC